MTRWAVRLCQENGRQGWVLDMEPSGPEISKTDANGDFLGFAKGEAENLVSFLNGDFTLRERVEKLAIQIKFEADLHTRTGARMLYNDQASNEFVRRLREVLDPKKEGKA